MCKMTEPLLSSALLMGDTLQKPFHQTFTFAVDFTLIVHIKKSLYDFLLNVHGKQLRSCRDGQLS